MNYYALLWTVCALLPAVWLLSAASRLWSNYRLAKRIGLPIIVIPVDPMSPLWMVVNQLLKPYLDFILGRLPWGSGYFSRVAYQYWEVAEKARIFLELGDAFTLVTTGRNMVYVCNAEAFVNIMQRKNDFLRPPELMGQCRV